MVFEWLILLAAMLALGLWLDALRQREHALRMARQLCQARGIQLLDETVGLAGLKLLRGDGLHLERHYSFEVSLNGDDRYGGHLWIAAGRMTGASLPDTPETVPPIPAGRPSSQVVDLEAHRRRRHHLT